MSKSITLIQPRHTYAPENGLGHIYMPNSLLTFGAQLQQVAYEARIYDENMDTAMIDTDIVGINLLGAPYIPEAQKIITKIRKSYGNQIKIILGWQVLAPGKNIKHPDAPGWSYNTGVTSEQFSKLFGRNVYNGMVKENLQHVLGISDIPPATGVSIMPMYHSLWDAQLLAYMRGEIPLYVSQGCAMNCSFCAAVKWTPEAYRDIQHIQSDMMYLLGKAKEYYMDSLSFYMTNLDVFQSPKKLFAFAKMIQGVRKDYPNIDIKLRWLAWVSYFNKAYDYQQGGEYLIEELKKAWFTTVWFGIDGVSRDIRKGIKKPQNTEKEILDALNNCKEAGLIPETLMVFGHPVDTEKSLQEALQFVQRAQQEYGAIPRPHISKSFVPGNDGRNHPDYERPIQQMLQKSHLFQSLDFTALPSFMTHPDRDLRRLVRQYVTEMTKIPGNTTKLVEPYDFFDTNQELEGKKYSNLLKYDR